MIRALGLFTALLISPLGNAVLAQVVGPEAWRPLTHFRDHLLNGQPCHACPQMTVIPTGSFGLGSHSDKGHSDERGPDENPLPVTIKQPLAFSSGEVSRREFAAFIEANPAYDNSGPCAGVKDEAFVRDAGSGWRAPGFEQNGEHPVVCVNWRGASAYAAWLSKITGRKYRLPSEAEWEFAARAGSRANFWWGARIMHNQVNCRIPVCDREFKQTAPFSALSENPWGLRHMLGNVWEWTADCYDAKAYKNPAANYPAPYPGTDDCRRVIRGGSWQENPWSLRVSNREAWRADIPLNDIGFRVVREGEDFPI